MRIGQTGNNQVQNRADSAQTSDVRHGGKVGRADRTDISAAKHLNADDLKAEISNRAKDAAMAKDVAMKAPDVREQKIAQLKKMIAEGRYNRNPHDVADRLVDDHMRGIS